MIYTFSNIILGTFARHKFSWPRGSGVYNALVKNHDPNGKSFSMYLRTQWSRQR